MDKYEVVRNAIPAEVLKLVKDSLVISKDADYAQEGISLENTKYFGDQQCPDSYVSYGHPVNEALLMTVLPIYEKVTGKSLSPTYSYSRIYWKNAILEKHKDRASCQYSATLCIDIDPEPWPIYMEETPVTLMPGDLVFYKGMDVVHWRKPYEGKQQIQIFLHYVDKDDKYAEWAFDKRPVLGFDKAKATLKSKEKLQKAVELHQKGSINEAAELYAQVIRIQPKNSDALNLLGVAEKSKGNFVKAIELLTQAISINSNNPNYWFNLGNAYKENKEYVRSIECYDKAIEIKIDFGDAVKARKIAKSFL